MKTRTAFTRLGPSRFPIQKLTGSRFFPLGVRPRAHPVPGEVEEDQGDGGRPEPTRTGAERGESGDPRRQGVRGLQRGGLASTGGRSEGRHQTQHDGHETRVGLGRGDEKLGGKCAALSWGPRDLKNLQKRQKKNGRICDHGKNKRFNEPLAGRAGSAAKSEKLPGKIL